MSRLRDRLRPLARFRGFWPLAAVLLLILVSGLYPQGAADAFLSRDQQGRLLFQLGRYREAASRFEDLHWRAFAGYAAGDFGHSARLYQQVNGELAAFARANALAHGQHYRQAQAGYRRLLRENPRLGAARINLEVVETLIAEMEKQDSGRKSADGRQQVAPELGDSRGRANGQGQRQGAERTAEESMQQGIPKEAWLRKLQISPQPFLKRKFAMEYRRALEEAQR
ncbi:hypothetical protein [Ferrimonas sediminicola]|uniref:hypothetical protein n=1 Tax=Ferrimonas sediminicola TaxID=2569538 RepID=UPI00145DD75F|nr:hypothetical protein [Ferrimonas sediminicola]